MYKVGIVLFDDFTDVDFFLMYDFRLHCCVNAAHHQGCSYQTDKYQLFHDYFSLNLLLSLTVDQKMLEIKNLLFCFQQNYQKNHWSQYKGTVNPISLHDAAIFIDYTFAQQLG